MASVEADPSLTVFCPPAAETRPHGAVEEAQQRVLGGRQLHPQPHQGRVHLHHLQHDVGAAPGLRDQDGGPQEDVQQRQQDRQDVPDCVSRPLWDLQPRLLGNLPEQRTGDKRSCHLNVIFFFFPNLFLSLYEGRSFRGGSGRGLKEEKITTTKNI